MAARKKEPLISKENRPTAIDYDMPIGNFKLGDLQAVIHAQISEHFKEKELKPEKEILKGDHFKENVEKEISKGDHFKEKVEKEILKGDHLKEKVEKEIRKPEGFKPEGLKPEGFKPEKPIDENTLEQIAEKVAARLRGR
jgi:hypothetical protein